MDTGEFYFAIFQGGCCPSPWQSGSSVAARPPVTQEHWMQQNEAASFSLLYSVSINLFLLGASCHVSKEMSSPSGQQLAAFASTKSV